MRRVKSLIFQMNMYIKKYRIYFLCFAIFGLWILLCFSFIVCSYTDFCVLKKIENADTLSDYIPEKFCSSSKMEGINKIYTSNDLKVLVVPPKNHKPNKKYSALIVFPPAGGCVILNAIISITAMPTARPIARKKIVLS